MVFHVMMMQVYRPQFVPSGDFAGSAFDAPRCKLKSSRCWT